MPIKRLAKRVLASLIFRDGWALVPGRLNSTWPQQRFLRSYLKRLDVDCVLDVGANVGQFGRELRKVGYDGRIISFEPDPACFTEIMKDAQRDPKWDVLNIALGDSAGILKLNLMEKSVFNSFLTPSSSETKLWEDQNLIKTTLDVEINTLNNVIPGIITKYQIRNFFLKMDTQGFDMNVFRGASDFYGSIVGLQSELPIKKIYEQAASLTDALDEYQAAGYEVSALYPVNPDFAELIEMDCYMTKSTLVSVR